MGQGLAMAFRRFLEWWSPSRIDGRFTQDELLQNLHLHSDRRQAELQAVARAQREAINAMDFTSWATLIGVQDRENRSESLRVHP